MYIILVFEDGKSTSYLTKDKKIVANLCEDAIFDTYSGAASASCKLINRTEVISSKDIFLSEEGKKFVDKFCQMR
jgi:hypothetical protein